MINVGITGQPGFIGTNLFKYLSKKSEFNLIPFEDCFYDDKQLLQEFIRKCDVVVHLAAVMRSKEIGYVYNTNMRLVNDLVEAADTVKAKPSILFASSIQEAGDSEYARCKRDGAEVLRAWCEKNDKGFCKMVFPNLFGPYAKPNYSSFIATFCYKLTHGEQPQVLIDNEVPLLYIGDLVSMIADEIKHVYDYHDRYIKTFEPQFVMKVSEVLNILCLFKTQYFDNNQWPELQSKVEQDLFTTFCSYKNE